MQKQCGKIFRDSLILRWGLLAFAWLGADPQKEVPGCWSFLAAGSGLLKTLRRAGREALGALASLWRGSFLYNGISQLQENLRYSPQRTVGALLMGLLIGNLTFVISLGRDLNADGIVLRALLWVVAALALWGPEGGLQRFWEASTLARLWRARRGPRADGPSVVANTQPPLALALGTGILLGAGWFGSSGGFFLALVIAGVTLALRRVGSQRDGLFLSRLFLGAVLLRLGILALVQAGLLAKGIYYDHHALDNYDLHIPMAFGDGGYFTAKAWSMAQLWRGGEVWPHAIYELRQDYGSTGYLFFPALYFYFFGPDAVLSARFINPILGGVLPLLAFGMGRDLFGHRAARVAGVLTACFPSLILWTLDSLKDPLFTALTLASVWATVRYFLYGRWGQLALGALAAVAALWIRFPFGVVPILVVALGSLFLLWRLLMRKSRLVALALVGVLAVGIASPQARQLAGRALFWTFSMQRGMTIGEAGHFYEIWDRRLYGHSEPETFTRDIDAGDVIQAVGLGHYHFWLEPRLWDIPSPSFLPAVPQMLFWILSLPLGLAGLWLLRRRRGVLFVVFCFLLIASTTIAMVGGNTGTVFRLRDLLTPVWLVLAGGSFAFYFLPPSPGPEERVI